MVGGFKSRQSKKEEEEGDEKYGSRNRHWEEERELVCSMLVRFLYERQGEKRRMKRCRISPDKAGRVSELTWSGTTNMSLLGWFCGATIDESESGTVSHC